MGRLRFSKLLINIMKKILKKGLITVMLIATIFTANYCLAASSIVDNTSQGYASGDYNLNDVREYAIYLMQFILGLVGTISLVMFVYGGLTFLLSAGNSNNIKKGMEILKAAVIGLILVFASVLIIKIFFGGLFGVKTSGTSTSGSKWNESTGAIEY